MQALSISTSSIPSIPAAPAVRSARVLEHAGDRITYRGAGYLYHFRKTSDDMLAKLKISRKMLDLFVKRVGAINSINLPGLTVACQGGGWYEVFTIDSRRQTAVLNFLKRLNLWVWRLANPHTDPRAPKPLHYTVTARVYDVPTRKNPPPTVCPSRQRTQAPTLLNKLQEVAPMSTNSLVDMVAKFKAKYGKN